MATYITTVKFTPQGIGAVAETTKRSAAFKTAAKKMGVKVSDVYWTLGPFDGVIIFDAPDEQTATAAMLSLSRRGNVQTSTSRAFDAGEMDKIIGMLGK
jgi:uncharacterized protein with GYD domain